MQEIASLLRIEGKLENRATRLSGGEMQRVAIGRALVRKPAVFLMDEPLSSLDAKLREELRIELKRIQLDLGATILYVTHDQVEALTLADRIGVLSAGEIVQVGTPRDVYERPRNTYVAQRLGSPPINLLPGGALGVSDGPAGAATVGVRPEDVVVGRGGEARACWRWSISAPSAWRCSRRTAAKVHALLAGEDAVAPGESTTVMARSGAALFFDAAGARIASLVCARCRTREGEGVCHLSAPARLLDAAVATIREHADELTALDQAIGDGDHGLNMRRGFDAIAAARDELTHSRSARRCRRPAWRWS